MEIQPVLISLISGLLGGLIVVLITEYFRRRSRIELYSKETFQKRLDVYEKLYKKLRKVALAGYDIMENPEYTKEKRYEIWASIIRDTAQFIDSNSLYINSIITAHFMTIFGIITDVYYIEDSEKKKGRIESFQEAIAVAERMIKLETGLKRLDELFGSITKAEPKHISEIISYHQKLARFLKE